MKKLIEIAAVLLSVFITQLCFAGDIEKLQPDMAYESEQPAVTGGESTTLKIRQKTGKNEVIVQIDKITKSPHSIIASGLEVSSQDKISIKSAIDSLKSKRIDKNMRLKGEALSVSQQKIDQAARRFIRDNKDILSADESSLKLINIQKVRDKAYVTYQQYYKDIPVYQAIIRLVITQEGKVPSCGSDYHKDINVCAVPDMAEEQALITAKVDSNFDETKDEAVSGGLLILPLKENGAYTYHLAYKLAVSKGNPPACWVYFIDAHTKEILVKYNDIRYETVSGRVTGLVYYYDNPYTLQNAPQKISFRDEYVNMNDMDTRIITDIDGSYKLFLDPCDYTLTTSLEGPWVKVTKYDGNDALYSKSVSVPAAHNIDWNTSGDAIADTAEMNCFYYVNEAHNYVKNVLKYDGMDWQIKARIGMPSYYGNAVGWCDFYKGEICFTPGGFRMLANFPAFSPLIYHEYTHAVTKAIYKAGEIGLPYEGESGAIDEGLSSYFTWTIIAEETPDKWGIDLSNTLKYPDDIKNETHQDGAIIRGAFWDLRKSVGKELADNLIHNARFGCPSTFSDYLSEMLIVDDDDDDIFDGTPHEKEIKAAFEKHGITITVVDTTPPTGTVKINNDARYTSSTSVTLTLSATDAGSGVSQMMFYNTNNFRWSAPEPYAASKPWTIPLGSGSGGRVVYVKFKDGAGNWSGTISDSITLDTTPPTGTVKINNDARYTSSTSVTLTLSATDAGSGVSQMMFYNTNNFRWSAPEPYAASKPWTIPLGSGSGGRVVYVKFKDGAGNWSGTISDSITLDTTPPTGTVKINGEFKVYAKLPPTRW